MIFKLGDCAFFTIAPKSLTRGSFVAEMGARDGSYAADLAARIYDYLIGYSRDVLEEYGKYYAKEYADLASFLFWKYGTSERLADRISDELHDCNTLRYSRLGGGDSPLGYLILSDEMIVPLNDLLTRIRGKADEDQN